MLNGHQHLLRISHMSHATSYLMPWFAHACSKRECFGVCAAWGLWGDSESESGRRGIDLSVPFIFAVTETLFVVAKESMQPLNTMFFLSFFLSFFCQPLHAQDHCPVHLLSHTLSVTLPELCPKVANLAFAPLVPPSVFHLSRSLVVCRSYLLQKVFSGANSSQVFFGLSWKMASACTPKQLVQTYFNFNFNFWCFSLFGCKFHGRHWICFLGFVMLEKGKMC